jgi:hypothetical protein
MKVTTQHKLYNESLTLSQINCHSLAEAIDYIQNYCGGVVWSEIETTEQPLPKYSKYVDTFYNINVYYDSVTESFLFEEFN